MRLFTLLFAFILFTSSRCNEGNADAATLIGDRTWYLKEWLSSNKAMECPHGVSLHVKDGKLTGFGGCNRYFGEITFDGPEISISKIGATRKYCRQTSDFEHRFFQALQKASKAESKDSLLYLITPAGKLVFTSEAPDENPTKSTISRDLEGTTWVLKSIQTKEDRFEVRHKAHLQFNRGRISGFGGCNNFSGNAKARDGKVSVDNILSTEMYCEEVGDLENYFFNILNKINRYSIRGNRLILSAPNGELELEAQQ